MKVVSAYAGAIKDICGRTGQGYCGQTFDDGGFNVIARAETCEHLQLFVVPHP